ncbi:hypothetical protein ACIG54_00405 [Streptomyces achromogenes]
MSGGQDGRTTTPPALAASTPPASPATPPGSPAPGRTAPAPVALSWGSR